MSFARGSLVPRLARVLACLTLALMFGDALADTGSPAIVGSWKLYKDDDRPKGPIVEEILNFWPSGKFTAAGESPYRGRYQLKYGQLQLLAKVGDRAIPITRGFELHDGELWLKNRKTGWAYYRRLSAQPQGNEPRL